MAAALSLTTLAIHDFSDPLQSGVQVRHRGLYLRNVVGGNRRFQSFDLTLDLSLELFWYLIGIVCQQLLGAVD